MARLPAAQRRKDFVAAAVRVIAEHGVAGATTRRIADEAGAALAALHYCFGSKEDLFLAVYEEQAGHIRVPTSVTIAPASDLASAAMQALERSIDWFRRHPEWARAQVELLLWSLRHDDGALGARSYDLHHDAFTSLLTTSVGPDDNPDLVEPAARLIVTLIDGLLLQWLAYADDARLVQETKRATEVVGAFLAGPPAARPRRAPASRRSHPTTT